MINQVREDDLNFKNEKSQEKVSLVDEEHFVVERCRESSLSKLTHIIVKQVHRKARVGVRKLRNFSGHGKRNFQVVSKFGRLVNFASKKLEKNMSVLHQTEGKGRKECGFQSIDTFRLLKKLVLKYCYQI